MCFWEGKLWPCLFIKLSEKRNGFYIILWIGVGDCRGRVSRHWCRPWNKDEFWQVVLKHETSVNDAVRNQKDLTVAEFKRKCPKLHEFFLHYVISMETYIRPKDAKINALVEEIRVAKEEALKWTRQ